ncbi:pilus assembly protein PilM [Bacillus sp. FJAT-47783]|uniref:type IV pilus biogenesis protein PilM n=1 Tax=Bacillus sp. FJAT-47783 TaxID=2922712 RepID=UPI001FADC000|nr:pilus assembly protein PilM [Bacillus sp. FJAT-47783]
MRISSLISKGNVVNVEIKDDCIRYVELKSKEPLVVSHFGEHYLEEGIIQHGRIVDQEAFSTILATCIQKWRLKRKAIRFILPDAAVVVRTDDVPADVPDDEIIGHLYFELDHSIHLPFDQPIIDAAVLRQNEEKKKVLLVAAPKEVVHSFQNELKEQRTNPTVADISPLCQYRLFHHFQLTSANEHYLLIQMNMKTITVSIFDEDRPSFMQQFPIPYMEEAWKAKIVENGSLLDLTECKEVLVLSAIEDIFIEIERILRFYQFSIHNGTQEITKLLLSGDHPFFYKIKDTMKNRFTMPIVTISEEFIQTSQKDTIQPKWFSALGLAVREGN